MKNGIRTFLLSFLTGYACMVSSAYSAQTFDDWKTNFKKRALQEQISSVFLNKTLKNINFYEFVVKADRNQPEIVLSFDDYITRVLTPAKIKKGKEILKKYRYKIGNISHEYKIPGTVLVALWGLETYYGQIKGKVDTGSALATLAYEGRRERFFTNELIKYLHILERENIDSLNGSWAGALGHFQFMPSTYAAYAVDGNHDGKIDIVNDLDDAFASAAHYLKQMGWKTNVRWGREVSLPNNFDYTKPLTRSLKEWKETGILPHKKLSNFEKNIEATLIFPDGYNTTAYLVYRNFFVVKKWNNSNYYALAVGLLWDALQKETETHKKIKKSYPFSKEETILIQTYLAKKSFYDGKVDGIFGPRTQKAISRHYRKTNEPIERYLQKVRSGEKHKNKKGK